jgi:hypothetical protein
LIFSRSHEKTDSPKKIALEALVAKRKGSPVPSPTAKKQKTE